MRRSSPSIRGTIFNNVWWVIVVTSLATALGLAVAVLADRAKAENTAKSLIFLPMAISFIGAGIIWRFMYQARDPSQNQTGVLNAIWVWIGESTTSTTGKSDLARRPRRCSRSSSLFFIKQGIDAKSGTMAGFAAGFLLLDAYLIYRILGPGLGGYVKTDGVVKPRPVLFVQEAPFNNMWLMVVLIWVAGRVRHGDPVGGDQGRADRADRGGQGRRGHRLAGVLEDHAAADRTRPSAS